MGYVKEPEGVDFVIKGKPLTEEQKLAISEFIKSDKERISKLKEQKTKNKKRSSKSSSSKISD
jgi:hypothetical protein